MAATSPIDTNWSQMTMRCSLSLLALRRIHDSASRSSPRPGENSSVSSSSRRHHVSLSSRRHHFSLLSRRHLIVISLPSLRCHRHCPCQPRPPPSLPMPSLARHPCRCRRCLAALALFIANHSHRLRHHPRPRLFVARHPSHHHHCPLHCCHLCPCCCCLPATLVTIAIALFIARQHRAVPVTVARPPPFLPSP